MNTQNHHAIPISLYGPHIPENLMTVRANVHEQIHKTLDIPANTYSKLTRRYKEKFNNKYIVSPDEVQFQKDMQDLYFENIGKLSPRLQSKHIRKMMDLFEYNADMYFDITGNNFDRPKRNRDKVKQFNIIRDLDAECKKEMAKIFCDTIRKQYYT